MIFSILVVEKITSQLAFTQTILYYQMDILNCCFLYILICHFLYFVTSRLQIAGLICMAGAIFITDLDSVNAFPGAICWFDTLVSG
jgi:hypothetical protein